MIKNSLFAGQEREAKLDKLGDALRTLQEHVDFAALAAEIERALAPVANGRPPAISHRTDGEGLADSATAQSQRRTDGIPTARSSELSTFRRLA